MKLFQTLGVEAFSVLARKKLLLVVAVFITATTSSIFSPIAFASGESYKWTSNTTIQVSGGDLTSPYVMNVFTDVATKEIRGSGTTELEQDGDNYCKPVIYAVLKEDRKSGTIKSATIRPSASSGDGPAAECNDDSLAIMNGWVNSSFTISGNVGTESPEQKQVDITYSTLLKKSESPKSVTFTAKGPGGLSGEFKSNKGTDGKYYGTWSEITAGEWTFCVKKSGKLAGECEPFTKLAYQKGLVLLGEARDETADVINVRIEVNPRIEDPYEDESFGPFAIELRDKNGKVLKTKNSSVNYVSVCDLDSTDTCGGGAVFLSDSFTYQDVKPGDYKVCYGSVCVDAKKIDNKPLSVELKFNQSNIDESGSGSSIGEGVNETSCDIDGVGWIVCPVMNFLAELNDKAFGFLQSLLAIRPSLIQDKATVTAWERFRDLANVAFIIAFLVIIYSQITSVGISNYGIKKLLPKIAVSAILVNLSLFLCQILVDASNIAGASLYSFIEGIVPPLQGTAQEVGWGASSAVLLAGGIGVVLIVFLGAAPAVLLALFLVLFILIARQAFILILVIISPLAFVAYLLPNTENLFKKWWKALSATLLVYPIIGVVFGASTLASNILMSIASDNGNTDIAGSEDSQLLAIVALAVMAIPLFAVPVLLKGAMSSAGAIGAKLANLQDRANKGASGRIKERAGQELNSMKNNVGSRLLSSNSRGARTAAFFAGTRRKANREAKYKDNEALRTASEDAFTNREGSKTAERKGRVTAAQETADLRKQIIQNQAKQQHLNDNHNLHDRATATGLDLHNAEETHKNIATAAHMTNNPNQYDNLNVSRGVKQNTELDATRRYEGSATGQALGVQRQGFEDQVATEKARQSETYKTSAIGQVNTQARKAVEGSVKIADQTNELRFQRSEDGQEQALELQGVDGALEIVRGDQKLAFSKSTTGQVQAQTKKVIQGEQKIEDGGVELRYEASDEGRAANVSDAVVQAQLGAAKAANSAEVEELKAGESANSFDDPTNVRYIADPNDPTRMAARDLNAAATQTRAQTQRSASAQNVANVEYAGQVKASENIPGDLADISGGIDPQGASRAVAVATQVIDRQIVEAIGAQKTTLESTENDDLASEYKTGEIHKDGKPTGVKSSPERFAAVAGTIAGRGFMGGKLDLLKATGPALKKAKADALARGVPKDKLKDDPEVAKIIYSQKQIAGDMKEWPFGASDTMRDKLGIGDWDGDFDAGFQYRIGTKLTGAKLGTLKAEELADLEKIFPTLTPEQRTSLDKAVEEARDNEAVRKDIKPEIWNSLEKMGYPKP